MLRSSSNLGLPRKVVVYYLLFCLVAISFMAVSILLTSHSVMESRTTSVSLARLGKIAALLELEYLRSGVANLQTVLQNNASGASQSFCSVVSLEGTILAHTDPSLLSEPARERKGDQLRWGNVSGIQYQDDTGQTVQEYSAPLVANENHFGSLRICVKPLNFWSTLMEILRVAPSILLLPLALIAAGGMYLAQLTGPLAQVDSQLRAVALQRPTAEPTLEALPAKDAISMGWNRVVDVAGRDNVTAEETGLQGRLAQVLAEREQNELQEVLHNLSDGIAVTDMEGRITFANRAVAALLGTETSNEELTGVELEGQLLEVSTDSLDGPLFENGTAHRPSITEIQRQADQDERTLRVARLPMEGETVRGHVWSVRDVTQQKLTEKSRDQFIDVATHELRTPLSNIKAYAETLATSESIEVEQQKEFCNIINGEVTRLARFVDDLLSISSIEAGSITIQRQRTISSRLFEEVLAKVQPLMKQKEIDFDVQLPEKMADMQLDKDKIVAVLVNLLGNAAKYTPEKGSVSLRVNVDETQLQVAVVDSGVGIAPDELPKVFDKFFRSKDPRVQEVTGTGLGLSLAREVVRMHGGEITAESKVDQGTTFVATIPFG